MITASHKLVKLESTIKNIKSTFHCGICGSGNDPIEFDQPRGLEDALVIQGLLLKGNTNRVDIRPSDRRWGR